MPFVIRGVMDADPHLKYENMNSLNVWYDEMPKGQKIFVYLVSIALVLAYGIGLAPLAALIYLELGVRGRRG